MPRSDHEKKLLCCLKAMSQETVQLSAAVSVEAGALKIAGDIAGEIADYWLDLEGSTAAAEKLLESALGTVTRACEALEKASQLMQRHRHELQATTTGAGVTP